MPNAKVPVPDRIALMIVGAQKAGTTSLKNYLGEHPAVKTHPQKEFSYFYDDQEYSKGYPKALHKYFGGSSDGKILVAKNAALYIKEDSLFRLKHHNPDTKIAIVLRDPVERTYSAYNMEVNYASLTEPFDHIVDVASNENKEDWKFEILIGMSLYCIHLAKLFSIFPKEQVKIYRFEQLTNNASSISSELFQWMNVDPSFKPDITKKHNVTVMNRSPFYGKILKKLLNNNNPIKKVARTFIPTGSEFQIGEMMRKMNRSNRSFNPISEESETFLREYFRPYNDKLSEMTGTDFSDWNKMSGS